MEPAPNDVAAAGRAEPTPESLGLRVAAILEARPAYRGIVEFYLSVFRRQLEWRGRVRVRPGAVSAQQRKECLEAGAALASRFDPGLDPASLAGLWSEMKDLFRAGNDLLRGAVDAVDRGEERGDLDPGPWLAGLRPDNPGAEAKVAKAVGVAPEVLTTLARAATLPHWRAVAQAWLTDGVDRGWRRFRCPVCGGGPSLGELRTARAAEGGEKAAPERFLHCSFCGTSWVAPSLECPACESSRSGDAKYFFSPDEPGWRIDFCESCKSYLKVVDGDRLAGPVHAGLELVASVHLDQVAVSRGLKPMGVDARPSGSRGGPRR